MMEWSKLRRLRISLLMRLLRLMIQRSSTQKKMKMILMDSKTKIKEFQSNLKCNRSIKQFLALTTLLTTMG